MVERGCMLNISRNDVETAMMLLTSHQPELTGARDQADPTSPGQGRDRRQRTKAGLSDARRWNRNLVFDALYHHGPLSRADLGRLTGLTAPTVSAVVTDLRDDHLVTEGPSTGVRLGKPPVVVAANNSDAVVIAVDLSGSDARGAAVRLDGQIVWERHAPLVVGPELLDQLVSFIVGLVADAEPNHVLGVGVAMPGVLATDGTVLNTMRFEWRDVGFGAALAAAVDVPVRVSNDVNAAVVAARLFRGMDAHNLFLVSLEHGVGAGIIVGNVLIEGEAFAAGEIGHLTIDTAGPACSCGRRGCLNAYLAPKALRQHIAEQGDQALHTAGTALGQVTAPIISALNLSHLIVVGPSDLVNATFLDALTTEASARILGGLNASLDVHPLIDDHDLILHGALSLVLTGVYGVH